MTPPFDPTRAVVFDLERGRVALEGALAVLLPAEVVARVCAELDVAAVRQLGALLGREAGARVRTRVDEGATLESMVDHLGGEVSLVGLGTLSIERWGQALVVRVAGCPLGVRSSELMAGYVEAALEEAVARRPHAVVLEGGADAIRLLLCGKTAARHVTSWLASGRSFGDALAALHQASVAPGGY